MNALRRRYGHAVRRVHDYLKHRWVCTNKKCHDYMNPVTSTPGGGGYLACDRCGKMMALHE